MSAALPACTVLVFLVCLQQLLLSQYFCTKQGNVFSAGPQSSEALVCVLKSQKTKESTPTKWKDLNLYNCLQVIVKTIAECMTCLVVQDNLAFYK